jgi:hypothetical protein
MNSELEAIRDAADKTTGDGRDLDEAVRLADAYVDAHPGEFDDYRGKDMDAAVRAVEAFRNAGMDEQEWRAQTWIFHAWEFQEIGGAVAPARRDTDTAPVPNAAPRSRRPGSPANRPNATNVSDTNG